VNEAGSWCRNPAITVLRDRLRVEQPRPSRRWSDLALTCAMTSDPDRRTARERLAELAERQTHARYSGR